MKKNKKIFSKEFSLNICGHSDIDFIDIDLEKDTPLFAQALAIEHNSPETYCTITHFFRTAFNSFEQNDKKTIYSILSQGEDISEVNNVHLGLSKSSTNGKGSSYHILFPVFDNVMKIISTPDVSINILPLVAKNFDADRMSDLLCRICLKHLHEFTLKQCEIHGISLSSDKEFIGTYWDTTTSSWNRLYGLAPLYKGKPILLTPKNWVSNSSFVNPRSFLLVECATYFQNVHFDNKDALSLHYDKDANPYYSMPTKVEVYEKDFKGHVCKELIADFIQEKFVDPQMFFERKRKILNENGASLSDDKLDAIVYELSSNKNKSA